MTPETTTHQFAKQTKIVETVITVVAKHFKMTSERLLERGREEPRNTRRQIAMMLARNLSGMSYPDLARAFLKSDHGTIMHACEAVSKRADADPELRKTVESLREETSGAVANIPA